MKIYHYNALTLELLGSDEADADPLDEGGWLIPAQATSTPPPTPQSGKTLHFVNGAWVFVDIPVEIEPTPEAVQPTFTAAIQARLDAFAKTRNYDSILSACTYAASTVPKFAAEGQCCVRKRDDTWAASYSILASVETGTRPMPTLAEVEAELPALVWPA